MQSSQPTIDVWIRIGEFLFLAIGSYLGYRFGWRKDARDQRQHEREDDETVDTQLKGLREDVDKLYARNKELWTVVQTLQNEVQIKDVKIRDQQRQIEKYQDEISERDDIIRGHERRINRLEEQLKAVQHHQEHEDTTHERSADAGFE